MKRNNVVKNEIRKDNTFNDEFDLDLKVSELNPITGCDPAQSSSCSHRCTKKCSNSCSCDCKPNS